MSEENPPLNPAPLAVEEVAQLFPDYEMHRLLGCGGMDAVYLARQSALDRLVAIKLLSLEVSVDHAFAARFSREARAMAKLNHAHIVAVYASGTTAEGHLFMVMEYVEGASLREVIHQVALDPDQSLSLAGQIGAALAYAHGKGVVHRDIQPGNVMVDGESHVKVTNFGLARLTEPGSAPAGITMTGMIAGTSDYVAPEQKSDRPADHRADLYALGVTLYEMLCGHVPQGSFVPPSLSIGCDARIDEIVRRAMQPQPELRYQSALAMNADLATARLPRPEPAVVPAPVKKAAGSFGPLAALLALLAATALFWVKPWLSEQLQNTTLVAPAEAHAPPPPTAPDLTPPAPVIPETPTAPPDPAPEPKMAMEGAPPPTVQPQDSTASEARPPQPLSATGKWLAAQEPQWQAAFATEVSAPFKNAAEDLKKQYRTALEGRLISATRDAQLDDAVAVRSDLRLLNDGNEIPTEDDAAIPAALKTLRVTYLKALAPLQTDRLAKAKIVHARYDAILAQNQTLLTQRDRLDEAREIKAKREQLVAAWLEPFRSAAPPAKPINGLKPGGSHLSPSAEPWRDGMQEILAAKRAGIKADPQGFVLRGNEAVQFASGDHANGAVRVSARGLKGSPLRLIVRESPEGFYEVFCEQGQIRIQRINRKLPPDESWKELRRVSLTTVLVDGAYVEVELRVVGQVLTVKVNGKEVASVEDATWKTGRLGISSFSPGAKDKTLVRAIEYLPLPD